MIRTRHFYLFTPALLGTHPFRSKPSRNDAIHPGSNTSALFAYSSSFFLEASISSSSGYLLMDQLMSPPTLTADKQFNKTVTGIGTHTLPGYTSNDRTLCTVLPSLVTSPSAIRFRDTHTFNAATSLPESPPLTYLTAPPPTSPSGHTSRLIPTIRSLPSLPLGGSVQKKARRILIYKGRSVTSPSPYHFLLTSSTISPATSSPLHSLSPAFSTSSDPVTSATRHKACPKALP